MKIIAFSDIHRNQDVAQAIVDASVHADVIVGAGDFSSCGQGANDTIDILKQSTVPTLIVSGNHDSSDELRVLCNDWALGHFLHGDTVTLHGISFFGLGSEIPRRCDFAWNESINEEAAYELLSEPSYDVLITHTPPFGHVDTEDNGIHEGSESVLKVIEEKQPLLNLCGHMHFSWGQSSLVGQTRIHNLGPSINWFDI